MCAYIVRKDVCDRDAADGDAVMSVEEGGVKVGESAMSGPSESRDESEIDRRRCVLLTDIPWREA